MAEYDSKLDKQGKLFLPPKHHRVNMDSYLHSYLSNPAQYQLSVARAKQVLEAHCGPEQTQEMRPRNSFEGQRTAAGKEATGKTRDGQASNQKVKTDPTDPRTKSTDVEMMITDD